MIYVALLVEKVMIEGAVEIFLRKGSTRHFRLENPTLFYIIGYTIVKLCSSLAVVNGYFASKFRAPGARTGGNMYRRANLIVFWIIVLSSIALLLMLIIRPDLAPSWAGIDWSPEPVPGVEPAKNLWDWLQLLVIPLFLGVGAWWLGSSLWSTGQSITQSRLQADRELQTARQHRATLDSYYNSMTDLLLNGYLRSTGSQETNVRNVAQARTLALLRSLDGKHKGEALQFLYDSGLVGSSRIVELKHSDLSGAQLRQAILSKGNFWQANMSGADLSGANLNGADLWLSNLRGARLARATLRGTHLGGVNLTAADLRGADLTGANLRKAILDQADLTDAIVSAQQLSRAQSLKGLRLPNGMLFEGIGAAESGSIL